MDKTKSEILRYLGRRSQAVAVPKELDGLIDECAALMRETARARSASGTFPISAGGGLSVGREMIPLKGEHIARHLSGCESAILLAATLGAEADALILKWKRADVTRSFVLDACATQIIEEYCDGVQRRMEAEAAVSGFELTGRFSPGYGDFPLDVQPRVLAALNAERKIGLTCTSHLILLPRKSVTALIGLSPSGRREKSPKTGCAACGMRVTCSFSTPEQPANLPAEQGDYVLRKE